MTRNTKIWAVIVLVATALAIGTVFAAMSPRTRVRYWTWRMHSGDLETRTRARAHLLEIGRPTIDPVYVELVVGEVADRLPKREVSAFVGSVSRDFVPDLEEYAVETDLGRSPLQMKEPPRFVVQLFREKTDRIWELLVPPRIPDRRLVVTWQEDAFFEVSVPRGDPLSGSVIAGVKNLLERRK